MIRTVIACLMFICSFALAQTQTAPPSVLPNRPDAAGPGGDQDLLGEKFESMAAGISFRGPAGWKLVHNRGGDARDYDQGPADARFRTRQRRDEQ